MGKLAKQKFNAAASKNYREERNQRESQSQQKQQPQPVASKKSTPTTKPHKKQQPSVKVARPTGLAKATAVHPAKNNNMKKNKPPHPKKPNHSRVKSVFGPIATKKLPPSPPNVSSSSPSPSSLKKKKSNSSNSNSSNRGPQDCDHAPMSHPTHLYSKQQQQQQPKAKSNQSNNPHATTQTSNNATKRRKNAATARPATTKVTSVFENRKRKLLHLDESDEDDDFFRDFSPEIVLVARRNYQKQQQQQQQHAAAVQKPTKKKRARSIDLSFPKRTLQQQRPETTKAGKRGPLVSVRDSSHSSSTATRWNPKLPPLDTSPFLTTENMPWTMHGKPEKLLAALPTAATGAPVGSSSSFPSTMLQALDDELMAFHAYVQLTDVEQEARQNFVAHVQQLARDLFSSSVPSPRISSTIECQVFGSFAALDICSFRSDVDVALWGVVGGGPVPPRGATRRRDDESDPSRPGRVLLQARDICNKSQPHNNINNSVVQEAATPTQTIMPELDVALTAKRSNTTAAAAATATAQRRLKWQLALAAIDDANANTNGHHGDNETSDQSEVRDAAPVEYDCAKPLGQSDATKSIPFTNVSTMAMAVLPPVTTSDVAIDDEAAFFFIDRKGDTDATFLTMLEHDTNENENGRKVDILDNTVATENGESAHCEVESRSETIAVFPGLPLLKVDSFQDGDKSLTLVTSSGDEIDDADDDESGDDADPLESLLCEVTRQARLTNTDFITTKDAVEKLNEIAFDSGSAASSDDDTILDDNLDSCSVDSSSAMNVSFVAGPLSAHRGRNAAQSAGPQGRVRDAVIRALASMKNKLNKSKLTRKALLIKARVPIIKIDTCFGFEADIAIGGQTGTDTSLYAVTQIEKYQR